MKRRLVCLLLVPLLSGCISAGRSEENPTVGPTPPLLTPGVLKVGLANSLSSYYLYRGYPRGYEYELLRLLCDDQGWKLEIEVVEDLHTLIDRVENRRLDLAAGNLAVIGQRLEKVDFSPTILRIKQVLVQRQPGKDDPPLIRDPLDLHGRTVHVIKGSSHQERLKRFAAENHLDITIVEAEAGLGVDGLIEGVSTGDFELAIADDNIAKLHRSHLRNLNIDVEMSLSQKVGWALHKSNDSLQSIIARWWEKNHKSRRVGMVFNKYFNSSGRGFKNFKHEFHTIKAGKLSHYDDLFRSYSTRLGWDWRLLAAQAYQESQFDPQAVSSFGAVGLMQVMPQTALRFGVADSLLLDANQNLLAGVRFMSYLQRYWRKKLTDTTDINKFILASYNAGIGHVRDAQRLAAKYKMEPEEWDGQVEVMLRKKSQPQYYRDPVVQHGYCRGYQPVVYVREIYNAFDHYRILVPE